MKVVLAPVGSAGDVYPYLGLGTALAQRGHEVVVLTSGYFQEAIERHHLRFRDVLSKEEFLQSVNDPQIWDPRKGPLRVMSLAASYVERLYSAILSEADNSTVVVSSCLGWGARLAEEREKIPLVTLHLQPSVIVSSHSPPQIPGMVWGRWVPRWWNRAIYTLAERWMLDPACVPSINAFRGTLGLRPIHGIMHWWESPHCVVGAFPEWFASPAPDWPPQLTLTQFPLWDEDEKMKLSTMIEDFLNAGPAPIVFTPGTANKFAATFFQMAAGACDLMGCRGLLVSKFSSHLEGIASPRLLNVHYASFTKLLPRAAAIVHHGGIGTTARALASGIPQVIHPYSHDQPDNAERIERLGAGGGISPKNLTPVLLAQKLTKLIENSSVRSACREAARKIAAEDPFRATCEVVEARLNGKNL